MTKHLRTISVVAGLMLACMLAAQTAVSIPYSMGFEESDSLEWQNWHINNGPNASRCEDQWMVGTDKQSEGLRSLYISKNDSTARFGKGPCIQFAYRDFILPAGNYVISFDWACVGDVNASLYVGYGPTTAQLGVTCLTTVDGNPISADYTRWCQVNTMDMKGQRYWQNARLMNVAGSNREMRLFFAWCSNVSDTTLQVQPLGACIDNVLICSANSAPPSNVNVITGCDTTIVTWTGISDHYEMGYRRVGESNWHTRLNLTADMGEGSVIIENLEEGIYDFRVRGILGNDTSVYTYANSVVLFCPEAHCINYVNLHDVTGVVTCRTGEVTSGGTPIPTKTRVGVVDVGSDNIDSRHTVNWDIHAYDVRTHNRLPLVPEGELASVRLGNWKTGAEWESITYDYYVDSVYSILLLKYAVVLEDPGHDTDEQPRFTLSIKDQSGNEVDPTCGSADFHAGTSSGNVGGGWHYEPDLSWKEWTVYGVDLTRFVGQNLKITVSTYDCTLSGHYGYGYFCLGCAKAKIEGLSCGNDAKMTAQAPDGFDYQWSSIHNPSVIVSENRTLEVDASDTTTYRCRLIYKDMPECYFDLYSSLLPRFPVAMFSYKYQPTNCENRVVFTNQSHIMVKYEGDTTGTHHYDEPCEETMWWINNEPFTDKNPVYVFPNTGGRFPVTLIAKIANGKCTNDTTVYLDIPQIGDVYMHLSDSMCFGSRYMFGGEAFTQSGRYTKVFESYAGCDSVCTLNLKVFPEVETKHVDASTCSGIPLVVDGDVYPYSDSGEWIRRLRNKHGCDSTVVMNVTVYPMLEPDALRTMPYVCAPDSFEEVTMVIPLSLVADSSLVSISLIASEEAQSAGFEPLYVYPASELDFSDGTDSVYIPIKWSPVKRWIPGTYDFEIQFKSRYNCDVTLQTRVELRHGLSAMSQIYGYLFIQNPELNGGYNFNSFQWYKNGEKIIGANTYYLELDDDNLNSVFYCLVSYTPGDTVSTCPIRYDWTTSDPKEWSNVDKSKTDLRTDKAELMCTPTLVQAGNEVFVSTSESLQLFDVLGRKIDAYVTGYGEQQIVVAPMTPGIYVIQSQSGATARIIVQ